MERGDREPEAGSIPTRARQPLRITVLVVRKRTTSDQENRGGSEQDFRVRVPQHASRDNLIYPTTILALTNEVSTCHNLRLPRTCYSNWRAEKTMTRSHGQPWLRHQTSAGQVLGLVFILRPT